MDGASDIMKPASLDMICGWRCALRLSTCMKGVWWKVRRIMFVNNFDVGDLLALINFSRGQGTYVMRWEGGTFEKHFTRKRVWDASEGQRRTRLLIDLLGSERPQGQKAWGALESGTSVEEYLAWESIELDHVFYFYIDLVNPSRLVFRCCRRKESLHLGCPFALNSVCSSTARTRPVVMRLLLVMLRGAGLA